MGNFSIDGNIISAFRAQRNQPPAWNYGRNPAPEPGELQVKNEVNEMPPLEQPDHIEEEMWGEDEMTE